MPLSTFLCIDLTSSRYPQRRIAALPTNKLVAPASLAWLLRCRLQCSRTVLKYCLVRASTSPCTQNKCVLCGNYCLPSISYFQKFENLIFLHHQIVKLLYSHILWAHISTTSPSLWCDFVCVQVGLYRTTRSIVPPWLGVCLVVFVVIFAIKNPLAIWILYLTLPEVPWEHSRN